MTKRISSWHLGNGLQSPSTVSQRRAAIPEGQVCWRWHSVVSLGERISILFRRQLPVTSLYVQNHWPYSPAVCSLVFRLNLTLLEAFLFPKEITLLRHSRYQKCQDIYANVNSLKYCLVQWNRAQRRGQQNFSQHADP